MAELVHDALHDAIAGLDDEGTLLALLLILDDPALRQSLGALLDVPSALRVAMLGARAMPPTVAASNDNDQPRRR